SDHSMQVYVPKPMQLSILSGFADDTQRSLSLYCEILWNVRPGISAASVTSSGSWKKTFHPSGFRA
ncbi:MAG: hypothetical protein WA970_09765, partial [Gammaproteobacteria bacterium]